MGADQFRLFVSSGMDEFKAERDQIKQALGTMFHTYLYEFDEGAKSQPILDSFTDELIQADLYIGLFGERFGEWTIKEFEIAREKKIDCLIYEKELEDWSKRDDQLTQFMGEITQVSDRNGLTTCRFKDTQHLLQCLERDIGRWLRGQSVSTSLKIGEDRKYYCNRDNQNADFHRFDTEQKERLKFFIVDGERKQSHKSLVKRFSLEKTGGDYVKRPITISRKGGLERLKVYIRTQLFSKFGISPIPDDQSFGSLVHQILPEHYQKVFIIFRIEEDLLGDKEINDAIKWFSTSYCDKQKLTTEAPDFYFFLNIRYNETGASHKKSIKRELQKYKNYIKLDELDSVSTDDLMIWAEDNQIAESESALEEVISLYFEEDTYPMELAEIRLKKLIKDFNEGNQQLMELLNQY